MWLRMAYLQVDESYDAFNKLPHYAAIRQPSKRAVGEVKRFCFGRLTLRAARTPKWAR